MSNKVYGACSECGQNITLGHYRFCSHYKEREPSKLEHDYYEPAICKTPLPRTNTDLEEAQAQVKTLSEALESINSAWTSLPEGHHSLKVISNWLKIEMANGMGDVRKALSSSSIAIYQAERAVIDAVNFNSGTLTIIAQGNHFGSETVTHLLKLNTVLQELEHNNAGGES